MARWDRTRHPLPCVLALPLVLALLGWSDHARAKCPDGDPCETIHVYRLQSQLPIEEDAKGRPLLSLQEANATDAAAFGPLLASAKDSDALAIRYRVTRIAIEPNGYCECNLEYQDKGCKPTLPVETLRQCARACRYHGEECQVAGRNVRTGGGIWYAFPAQTQCGDGRDTWQKRTFGRTNPGWCDWREDARIVKRASCLAAALKGTMRSLDALFEDDEPCPRVD